MSETVTEERPQSAQEAAVEQPQPEAAAEAEAEAATGGQEAQQEAAKPEEDPGKEKTSRRIAHLTRRTNDAIREKDEAIARAARAEALLGAKNGEGAAPDTGAMTQQQIKAEAARIVAEERFNEDRMKIINAGVKEYGETEWEQKTSVLAAMGAMARPEFMEALLDLPEAHKLVVALADDSDKLSALLAKTRPAAMAAALGRMAAEMAVAEPTKEISKAPPPVKPVGAGRATPPPDATKMTGKEYIEFRNRTAPRHLGGQGKPN